MIACNHLKAFAVGCVAIASVALVPSAHAGEAGDIIRTHNAAFAQRDLDAFVSAYNDNAVVIIDGQEMARGVDQIRALYAADFQRRNYDIEIRSFNEGDYFVSVEEAIKFRDGRTVCCSSAEYEFFNGKISVARLTLPASMR